MIISNLVSAAPPPAPERARPGSERYPRVYGGGWTRTKSGKRVDEDSAKKIATAYECEAIISDDIGMMPLQVFERSELGAERVLPNGRTRNVAYLLERQPNRWMVPFVFKKTVARWMIWWGNAYIWNPQSIYPELFILDASKTVPVFDEDGNKWYSTTFPNGKEDFIPDSEMVHLMLNSKDGLHGLSVLEYARETMGRQLAAHETQDVISGNGLKPTAALWVKTRDLSQEARDMVRKTYLDAVETGAAIFETEKFEKFETITMKPTDAQFMEGVDATDTDIARFFKMPAHKLNMGKQSYESNEQQEMVYLRSCLNPFLVQVEQAGQLKWIPEGNQKRMYLKWNRDALLQTDAKTRTEVLTKRIQNGMYTPNQALAIEDQNGYPEGNAHYMQSSYGRILENGSVEAKNVQAAQGGQSEERQE